MIVKKIHLLELQNEEHDRFMTETVEVILQSNPEAIKIKVQYNSLESLVLQEHDSLDRVRKSEITEKKEIADADRDKPIAGMVKVVNGMLNHFNPEIAQAAHTVKLILDKFTGITKLADRKQSSATISMLSQLRTQAGAEIEKLGVTEWLTEIETRNNAFIALDTDQYDEKESNTVLPMKEIRALVDDAYNTITERLNALVIVEGEAAYAGIVTKLNLRIDSYNNTLAQRKGMAAAKAAKVEPKA